MHVYIHLQTHLNINRLFEPRFVKQDWDLFWGSLEKDLLHRPEMDTEETLESLKRPQSMSECIHLTATGMLLLQQKLASFLFYQYGRQEGDTEHSSVHKKSSSSQPWWISSFRAVAAIWISSPTQSTLLGKTFSASDRITWPWPW